MLFALVSGCSQDATVIEVGGVGERAVAGYRGY